MAALVSWNFINSASNISRFIHHQGTKVMFLLVYVDDNIIIGNDPTQIQHLISQLHSTFAMKNLGSVIYILGFKAHRNASGLFLTQSNIVVIFSRRPTWYIVNHVTLQSV
ncbi:hypothetical protein ACOSP7_014210 [Xanthoceras sorbifolium]